MNLFVGCNNDEKESGEEFNYDYRLTYAPHKNAESDTPLPIEPNETLSMKLGDTVELVFKPLHDVETDYIKVYGLDNLEVVQKGKYVFWLIAVKTGMTPVATCHGMNTIYFGVSVRSFIDCYDVIEPPVYTVIAENSSTAAAITEELKKAYDGFYLGRLELNYIYRNSGELRVTDILNSKEPVQGEFSVDRNLINLRFNRMEYNFIVEKSQKNVQFHTLTADLTGQYRSEHPSETIEAVVVVMNAIKSR